MSHYCMVCRTCGRHCPMCFSCPEEAMSQPVQYLDPPLAPLPGGLVTMTGDTLAAQTECQAIYEHIDAERQRAEDEGRGRDALVLEGVRLWLHARIEGR